MYKYQTYVLRCSRLVCKMTLKYFDIFTICFSLVSLCNVCSAVLQRTCMQKMWQNRWFSELAFRQKFHLWQLSYFNRWRILQIGYMSVLHGTARKSWWWHKLFNLMVPILFYNYKSSTPIQKFIASQKKKKTEISVLLFIKMLKVNGNYGIVRTSCSNLAAYCVHWVWNLRTGNLIL